VAVTSDTCELWANGVWQVVSVEDVLAKWTERKLRCVECKGAVRAHKQSADGVSPAHFEHREAHMGCSLCHIFVAGAPQTLHPKVVA
jgi:uncharacterized protein with PIN domain